MPQAPRTTGEEPQSLMRICAVIVTFNRPQSLIRCMTAVFNQTLRPDAVIVVDNCSNIPVADALRKNFSEDLQVFRFAQNTGGAGGFHFGMAEAFRQGFDAVWLMDDDGMASDSCLATLVKAVNETRTEFANPLVITENSPEKLVFGLTISGRVVLSTEAAIAAANSDGVIEGTINPFNGSLITRNAYRELGDVKFECFIWGDEEEYFERARLSKIGVGTVASARYYHPAAKNMNIQFGPRQSELKLCPPDRSHFHFRNIGFSKTRYRGIPTAVYHGLNYLSFLLKSRQLSEAWKFVWYYADGAFNWYLLKPSRSTLRRALTQVDRVDLAATTEAVIDKYKQIISSS
jgi:rhamnopyranosyl-N-acetylglucosaminyl-diphospho-decaprenol beta-1,3/1,4-galactofuranosyltransferase